MTKLQPEHRKQRLHYNSVIKMRIRPTSLEALSIYFQMNEIDMLQQTTGIIVILVLL